MNLAFVKKNAVWSFYAAFDKQADVADLTNRLKTLGYQVKFIPMEMNTLDLMKIRELQRALNLS